MLGVHHFESKFRLKNLQQTYRVHFKVDKLSTRQGNYNLSLVHSASNDGFLIRRFPLVDSSIRSNVPDAVWVNLHECVVAQSRAAERWSRSEETGVRHFFDSVANAQHQSSIDERHDDVSIEFIWKEKNRKFV